MAKSYGERHEKKPLFAASPQNIDSLAELWGWTIARRVRIWLSDENPYEEVGLEPARPAGVAERVVGVQWVEPPRKLACRHIRNGKDCNHTMRPSKVKPLIRFYLLSFINRVVTSDVAVSALQPGC
ncbi:hypothetical protein OCU04_002180 [Sclerotinia nivalis]|uniref:Uncharacterized protein n=1 Tax=Sclerotinia nivalis TaxID=352851 RepID=A0A9X0AZM6_9HELO|nr:hypothetical protein OCU04_002180 [Sclerotinia nivalis]